MSFAVGVGRQARENDQTACEMKMLPASGAGSESVGLDVAAGIGLRLGV